MPTQTITFPNGHSYTNDNNVVTGMGNGMHRQNLFPLLNDTLEVAADAVEAAASAVSAPGTSATSTTSLAIGSGSKTLTIQTGKLFSLGQNVIFADTTAPNTRQMFGKITAFNSGTGVITIFVETTDFVGSGTVATWTVSLSGAKGNAGVSISTLPILSNSAALKTLISPMLPIFDSSYSIATADFMRIMWAGSQFVAVQSASSLYVYTSPDLKTWTARNVSGVSTAWFVRSNGANVIACQSSGSQPRRSTDGGVSWANTTALPGSLGPSVVAYATSGTFIIGTSNSFYVTTDNGTTWSSSQTPGTIGYTVTNLYTLGATFLIYNNTSATYYTSTTGLTSSWTARTLPDSITACTIYDDGSGGLILIPSVTTKNYWGTTDGVNWTDLGFNAATFTSGAIGTVTYHIPFRINDVWVVGSNFTGVGSVLVKHAGSKWLPTFCTTLALSLTSDKYCLVASNGAGLYAVKPAGVSNVLVVEPSSTKCVGYFV